MHITSAARRPCWLLFAILLIGHFMQNISRPAPFVLISSNHGTMIVNRNDYHNPNPTVGYGVGYQIMNQSCFDQQEVDFGLALLHARKKHFGDGVVAIDCGANIGVLTIEWARFMYNWGQVYSFEAQEKIFYALAGNIIINNCLNVTARHAAVGAENSTLKIPEPNYLVPSSFGSFELKKRATTEFIGQQINYNAPQKEVPLVALDSLKLPRVDLLKIDVEGMEEDVLYGAMETISKSKPILIIEVIKSDKAKIMQFLDNEGYKTFPMHLNVLAIHASDPTLQHVAYENETLGFSASVST